MSVEQCGYCMGYGHVQGRKYDCDGRHRPDWPEWIPCDYCNGSGEVEEGGKLLPAPVGIMTVKVTADDIANGKPRSANGCPVALALRHATGWLAEVTWNCNYGWMANDRQLPAAVGKRIAAYDKSGKMKPFRFEWRG